MILRPITEPSAQVSDAKPRPVWDVLFEHQSKLNGTGAGEHGTGAGPRGQRSGAKSLMTEPSNDAIWLITQPAHSALSGEIAAKLAPDVFGKFDQGAIRAIALHDAGWSEFDSELIRASRSPSPHAKKVAVSFLGVAPRIAVHAWTASVETALKADLLGGFLVSEHFRSIAQYQVNENQAPAKEMAAFARSEEARQKKLRPKVSLTDGALGQMVEGLRFCDLLSLYICAGVAQAVEFPQRIDGKSVILRRPGREILRISPSPFMREEMFSFAALRHPRTKLVSSATFAVRFSP